MKILSKSDIIAISGFFLVVTFLSLWAIDISVSSLISGGYLSNGFFNSNPMVIYHVGLYIISFACFFNFLITIHILLKESSNKKKKEMNQLSNIWETE